MVKLNNDFSFLKPIYVISRCVLFSLLFLYQAADVFCFHNTKDSINPNAYYLDKDIPVKHFFKTIDFIAKRYSDSVGYTLSDYHIVNYNSWIIDSLSHTSYYWLKDHGIKDLNQKDRIVLKKGTPIQIPEKKIALAIEDRLKSNRIIINIPEYKMRVYHEDLLIYDCLIRVGKNESRYLKSIDKYMDLRTRTGKGFIYATERNPTWINPVDGTQYKETKRDDGTVTKMPMTPSITIFLNGYVSGQLIHATTNPETLGKPASNGCIGTSEEDIWRLYFLCPPGTKIEIIYDRKYTDESELPDIYHKSEHKYK